ncbi:MAG: hypothetical protein PUC16_04355 [Bacteroidales bacterium]|nr:hypothetical protein [Bacteroidales bacterium]MDD5975979.1 hypothetical protein [Bacteroidales bacterium]
MNKTVLYLMSVVVTTIGLNAQIISNSNQEGGLYNTPLLSAGNAFGGTVKTLQYNDSTFISFYNSSIPNRHGNFYRVQNYSSGTVDSITSVAMPNFFQIKDFAVLGDTLYFCGNINDASSSVAFMAYIGIEELFSPTYTGMDTNNIKYTLFDDIYQDSIYSIDRIEAYYDSCNNRVIAGIGKMLYGKPPYMRMTMNGMMVVDPDEYYLDFVMFYTIKEQQQLVNYNDSVMGAQPIYADANDVQMFYIPSDTINGAYYHKFHDITQTNNFVHIAYANHQDEIEGQTPLVSSLKVVQFDKNTLQNVAYDIMFGDWIHLHYGIKLANVGSAATEDSLSLSFMSIVNDSDSTVSVTMKLYMTNMSEIDIVHISKYDTLPNKGGIKDCKYMSSIGKLLVLKNTRIDENTNEYADAIFYIDMNDEVLFPYTTDEMLATPLNGKYIMWNNIVTSDSSHYSLTGYRNMLNYSPLFYFDKCNDTVQSQGCYTLSNCDISVDEYEVWTIDNSLQQCRFPKILMYTIDEGGGEQSLHTHYLDTSIKKAIIQYKIRTNPVSGTSISTICQY